MTPNTLTAWDRACKKIEIEKNAASAADPRPSFDPSPEVFAVLGVTNHVL
jgi:hypothetical protein